jgi:hypothetical protein
MKHYFETEQLAKSKSKTKQQQKNKRKRTKRTMSTATRSLESDSNVMVNSTINDSKSPIPPVRLFKCKQNNTTIYSLHKIPKLDQHRQLEINLNSESSTNNYIDTDYDSDATQSDNCVTFNSNSISTSSLTTHTIRPTRLAAETARIKINIDDYAW